MIEYIIKERAVSETVHDGYFRHELTSSAICLVFGFESGCPRIREVILSANAEVARYKTVRCGAVKHIVVSIAFRIRVFRPDVTDSDQYVHVVVSVMEEIPVPVDVDVPIFD